MATVLVTGGAGYVGSHACKALKAAGHVPVVFDNFSTGWRGAVRYGPLAEGDLLDPAALDRVFAAHAIDAVMHFAALSYVGESVRVPLAYWRNNLAGTLSLLEAMTRHGVGRIVFSSTCATYGEPAGTVLTETDAQAPINPYGQSKLAVERMLADTAAAHGGSHVIFRYFNAAGADPYREIGEQHVPETHLIPLVLDAVAGKRARITVFGTDYPTPDGTCIRDYIHVTDLADAHVRGLEHLLAGGGSLALNLGSGSGHSVRAVIETAAAVTGLPVPAEDGPRRPGDPARLVSGSGLAEARLGWRPRRSDLRTMIEDAWAWHRTGGFEA
ncbi:UDP-glucose 4-epimerase GalE [Paralimibaculum aggregatum]|uniref:UDP-glucose 4-epimerase n=1 Tax=Paralimibaculum aggregatum TaxID=3036245 RepID=A0ABQ6LR54_9RHOB|nr:UDP-glucose 4-epimerase GalE [Limibaculum sp. NKW23]GMG83395.1 UDP-glucose 4-epimerase GalE [Limibaculum sp. NKW23]